MLPSVGVCLLHRHTRFSSGFLSFCPVVAPPGNLSQRAALPSQPVPSGHARGRGRVLWGGQGLRSRLQLRCAWSCSAGCSLPTPFQTPPPGLMGHVLLSCGSLLFSEEAKFVTTGKNMKRYDFFSDLRCDEHLCGDCG